MEQFDNLADFILLFLCFREELAHQFQQGIFPQTAQEPVMPLEPGIITFIGQIVRKVQVDHGLLQIAGIIYIDDIGVFLAILLCISLGKLTFANTGNTVKEHLAVIHQQSVKLFQLLLPPKEVTVIRSMAPINLIVYYPKTEEGQVELAKRVSDVHAAAVTQRIKSLNCPTSQKLELLDAVIETVKERSRE